VIKTVTAAAGAGSTLSRHGAMREFAEGARLVGVRPTDIAALHRPRAHTDVVNVRRANVRRNG